MEVFLGLRANFQPVVAPQHSYLIARNHPFCISEALHKNSEQPIDAPAKVWQAHTVFSIKKYAKFSWNA